MKHEEKTTKYDHILPNGNLGTEEEYRDWDND